MNEQRTQHTSADDMKGFPSDRESNPVILRARIMAAVDRLKNLTHTHDYVLEQELMEIIHLLTADPKAQPEGRCSICGSWNPDHEVDGTACKLLAKV